MVPSVSTWSTTPMCSSHTIRSPGWGVTPGPFGTALPAFCAHAYTSSTRPKPWPPSPSGTPDWRAAQEVKYAHHGPTPEPAVAWRYCAMRGESLDPGGCSATPTSPLTALRIAWPAPVGAAVAVGVREAACAVWSWVEKAEGVGEVVAAVAVTGGVVGGAPVNKDCSWAMRAIATSKLMQGLLRHPSTRT